MPLTLYEKICEYLREGIQSNAFRRGTRIETESELMQRFSVSRVTVRNAIARLVEEGLLVRRQGKGTFVTSPRVEYDLRELHGTTEVLARSGLSPRMKIVSYNITIPEASVQGALRLRGDAQVLRVERLDLANDVPVALAIIYLPESIGRLLTPEDLNTQPLYHLMWDKCGVRAERAYQTLKAVKADAKVAHVMGIPLGDAVMLAQRTTFSPDDRPIEMASIYYRSEILYFSVTLQRPRTEHDPGTTVIVETHLARGAIS